MKPNLRAPISTLVAVSSGWLMLSAIIFGLDDLRSLLLGWVMLVAAAGFLLGVFNLASVHLGKLRRGSSSTLYSLALLGAMSLTFALTAFLGPEAGIPQWLFRYVQLPVEASLMAVMAITLTLSAARLLSRRMDLFAVLFLAATVLTLAGSGPLLGFNIPLVGDVLRPWLAQVLAGAGARGILLGVSFGIIATGLRALLAADRPYGG